MLKIGEKVNCKSRKVNKLKNKMNKPKHKLWQLQTGNYIVPNKTVKQTDANHRGTQKTRIDGNTETRPYDSNRALVPKAQPGGGLKGLKPPP